MKTVLSVINREPIASSASGGLAITSHERRATSDKQSLPAVLLAGTTSHRPYALWPYQTCLIQITPNAQVAVLKSIKKRAFVRISCNFWLISCTFLQLFAYFCLTHFNTCAFVRAKTLTTAQKQRRPPKIPPKKPQFPLILDF